MFQHSIHASLLKLLKRKGQEGEKDPEVPHVSDKKGEEKGVMYLCDGLVVGKMSAEMAGIVSVEGYTSTAWCGRKRSTLPFCPIKSIKITVKSAIPRSLYLPLNHLMLRLANTLSF